MCETRSWDPHSAYIHSPARCGSGVELAVPAKAKHIACLLTLVELAGLGGEMANNSQRRDLDTRTCAFLGQCSALRIFPGSSSPLAMRFFTDSVSGNHNSCAGRGLTFAASAHA